MGAKRMSEEEKNLIEQSLDAGYKLAEIAELTGRSYQTIKVYARKIRAAKAEKLPDLQAEAEEESKKVPDTYVWDHRDNPDNRLRVEIKKLIRITGSNTGYRYKADDGILVIHNDSGQEFSIELKMLDKWLDELDDIVAEAKKAKYWLE